MTKKHIAFFIAGQTLSLVGAGVGMFWSAGRLNWWAAWAVIGVWLVWFTAEDFTLLRFNPDLLAERLSPPKDAKAWDRALLSILRLVQLARYLLAGLDQRFRWTGHFPLSVQIAALGVCLLTIALFFWAMASNAYFSQVARIQTERGHVVTKSGPYSYVRHPAYLAMILFELALSALLGSIPALIAGGVCALLFILRTYYEDRFLKSELSGYTEYCQQVPDRLLPGIW